MSKVNKRALAEIFGISERTFTEYQKDSTFPFAGTGRGHKNEYDTVEVYQWLLSRAQEGANRESTKERLDRIRGDREELAHAADMKKLVPADEVGKALEQVVMAIRTELLSGNPKLKTELDTLYDSDIDVELLNEHSRSILRHLSDLGSKSVASDQ